MRLILFILSCLSTLTAANTNPGSVIVLNVSGSASAYMPSGREFSGNIERGHVLSEGLTLKTSNFAEVLLLFSNGTTLTVDQNSELLISKYKQSPFENSNLRLGEVDGEPSTSLLALDLKIGQFIAKTKKLAKGSSFTISTPAGTAGIRGTEFQIALDESGKLNLDVSESVVEFTPLGQTQPIRVSQGMGLDAPPNRPPQQRMINASAQAKISSTNVKATQVSSQVKVATISTANTSSATLSNEVKNAEVLPDPKESKKASSKESDYTDPSSESEESPSSGSDTEDVLDVFDQQSKNSESGSSSSTMTETSEEILIDSDPEGFVKKVFTYVDDAGSALEISLKKVKNVGLVLESEEEKIRLFVEKKPEQFVETLFKHVDDVLTAYSVAAEQGLDDKLIVEIAEDKLPPKELEEVLSIVSDSNLQPPSSPPNSPPTITPSAPPDSIPTYGDDGSDSSEGDSGSGTDNDGTGTGGNDDSSTGDDGSGTGEDGSGTGDDGSGTGDDGSGTDDDSSTGEDGSGTGEDSSNLQPPSSPPNSPPTITPSEPPDSIPTYGGDSGTGDDGSGTGGNDGAGTGGNDGAGTGDNGSGTGGDGSDTGENGSGTDDDDSGTGGNDGAGTGDDGSGTDDDDSGTGGNDGAGTGDNGSGTGDDDSGTGDDDSGTGGNDGTGTGDNGSGTGGNGSDTGDDDSGTDDDDSGTGGNDGVGTGDDDSGTGGNDGAGTGDNGSGTGDDDSGTGGNDGAGTGDNGSGTGGDGSGAGGNDDTGTGGDGTGDNGSGTGGDGSDGAGFDTGDNDAPNPEDILEAVYPYDVEIENGELTLDIKNNNQESLLNGIPFIVSGSNKDQIEEFLGEWFPGEIDDAEIFSIAAMGDYIDKFDGNVPTIDYNLALRRAINITSIIFNDFQILDGDSLGNIDWAYLSQSGNIPAGSVIKVEDLISIYSGDEYLYDFAKAAISQGYFGNNGQSNIATKILNFVGDENIAIPESLSLIDSDLMTILSLDNKPFDSYSETKQKNIASLTKIYLDNISGIIGNDIILGDYGVATTINVGHWLPKADKARDKKLFAFAASDDLYLRGEVNFQNRINDIVNKAEDHALILGAADHVEISRGAKINFEGSNLGIGSYSSLTLNEVSIETGGNLAIGSLDDLLITSNPSADMYSVFNVGKNSDRDNVYLFAEDILHANRLKFEGGRTRQIYMEGNTIILNEVHFPVNSEVMLRSKNGTPHFYGGIYSSESNSWSPYEVNFYSDSNTYDDRPILKNEFMENPKGGFDSQNFKTGANESAIKIRPILSK